MTDRELLEMAAKAMGFVQHHSYREKTNSLLWLSESGFPATWSPLTDDKDALRLAVKLNLYIAVREFRTEVFHQRVLDPAVDILGFELSEPFIKLLAKEAHDGDAYAATRRAIVRAAAEIGKGAP